MVPVEEADEAEDESSSKCSGSSETWPVSSSSLSSKLSAGKALRRFLAHAF